MATSTPVETELAEKKEVAQERSINVNRELNNSEDVPYTPHAGEGSQYLRDQLLGVNDGLISIFLLVLGVVGGGLSAVSVLLTAVSGAIAGAISMGLGEYVATKSQVQVTKADIALEKQHFKYHRDIEIAQLREFFRSVNITGRLQDEAVALIGNDDEKLLQFMMRMEFGVEDEEGERNPILAMWMSGRLFLLGSLPPMIPFLFTSDVYTDLYISIAFSSLALFLVGVWKCQTTKGVWWKEGLENWMFGCLGGALAYCVGVIFQEIDPNVKTGE